MAVKLNFPVLVNSIDTEGTTATSADIVSGKTAYSQNMMITGSMPTIEAQTITPTTTMQIISQGSYLNGDQTVLGDANLTTKNIKSGITIFGVEGDTNVVDTTVPDGQSAISSSYIAEGRTGWANGKKANGTAVIDKGGVYTVLSSDTTFTGPMLLEKNHTIVFQGEPELFPDNIKQGITIGGITGTYTGLDTSDANATAMDIRAGTSAYVDGVNIPGELPSNGHFTISVDGQEWIFDPGIYDSITVPAEPNLLAENIKEGVTIYGVTGTYSGGGGGGTSGVLVDVSNSTSKLDTKNAYGDSVFLASDEISWQFQTLAATVEQTGGMDQEYDTKCYIGTPDRNYGIFMGNWISNYENAISFIPVTLNQGSLLIGVQAYCNSWASQSIRCCILKINATTSQGQRAEITTKYDNRDFILAKSFVYNGSGSLNEQIFEIGTIPQNGTYAIVLDGTKQGDNGNDFSYIKVRYFCT